MLVHHSTAFRSMHAPSRCVRKINNSSLVIKRKNAVYTQVKAKNPDKWTIVNLSNPAKLVSDYRILFSRCTHISWVAIYDSCRICKPTDLPSRTTCVKKAMLSHYRRSWRSCGRGGGEAKASLDEPPSTVVAELITFTPDDHLPLCRTRHHSTSIID